MNDLEFAAVGALLDLNVAPRWQEQEEKELTLNNFRCVIRSMIRSFLCRSLQFRMDCNDMFYDDITNKIDDLLYFHANGDLMVYADPYTLNRRIFDLVSYVISTMYF
jgi:hypothetical protein